AVIDSALTYAGQKCSALSRVLVHEAVHDALLDRLAGAVEVLEVGPAEDLAMDAPAVIDEESRERHARFRELAAREGRIVAEARDVATGGHYVAPTVVADLPSDSDVLTKEI